MCGSRPCNKALCTWSEAWRAQCEARRVARLPPAQRQHYYAAVRRARGEAAVHTLMADMESIQTTL